MDRQAILQLVENDPRLSQVMDALEEDVADSIDSPEELTEAIQLIEFVLQNPDKYEEVLRAAVMDGMLDEGEAPPQFDEAFVIALLATLYSLQERIGRRGYARGGLAMAARQVAAAGRGGDTMLAHINPREAAVLKAIGGSGTINPHTGLREYKKGGLGKILKVAIPIALAFVPGMQGIAAGLGSTLGAGAAWAPVVGNAVIGGLTSAATGGNPIQGALMGGLTGGLGGKLGSNLLPNMPSMVQNVVGSGLVGAAGNLAQGKNALTGLAGGVVSGVAGNYSDLSPTWASFGKTAGNMLASGSDAKEALVGGGLSALATRWATAPRAGGPAPIENRSQRPPINPHTGLPEITEGMPFDAGKTSASTDSGLFSGKNILTGLSLASAANSLMSAPPDVQNAVQNLSPDQQEYFNQPSIQWDWNRLQQDANNSNMSLDQFIAQNWNRVTDGQYNTTPVQKAMGGALTRLARGAGSGRADTIDAKLSDGEYVIDAETVALLGDGSTDEGANRLDQMRAEIRRHKGKTLARGKFSPNAKSPLAYLKGAA